MTSKIPYFSSPLLLITFITVSFMVFFLFHTSINLISSSFRSSSIFSIFIYWILNWMKKSNKNFVSNWTIFHSNFIADIENRQREIEKVREWERKTLFNIILFIDPVDKLLSFDGTSDYNKWWYPYIGFGLWVSCFTSCIICFVIEFLMVTSCEHLLMGDGRRPWIYYNHNIKCML